jgi:two-component system, cell cycle sensor histidine kinase and response regulator CckA
MNSTQSAAQTQTILIAEDDRLIRHLVRTILERSGYQLLIAENGRHALELAAAHEGPIHLLLSDVLMPEMNGPDLAGKLQAARPGTPVVFMSAFTNGALREHGDYPFVPKPFSPGTLLETMRAALAGSGRIKSHRKPIAAAQDPWSPSTRPAAAS